METKSTTKTFTNTNTHVIRILTIQARICKYEFATSSNVGGSLLVLLWCHHKDGVQLQMINCFLLLVAGVTMF